MRLKVLHILNELKFSGAEILIQSGSKYFLDGSIHTVLSTGEAPGEYAQELADSGYIISHIPFSKSVSFFRKFDEFVREGKFDVIHVHCERAAFWYAIIARLRGAACVRTIHNEFLFEGQLARRRALGRQFLAKIGVRMVACSSRVAANEKSRFGISSLVIDNWLDPHRVDIVTPEARARARLTLSIRPDEFVVVSVGNYGPAKNQETLVSAVRRAATEIPIRYFHLGAGGSDLAAKMNVSNLEPIMFCGAVRDIRTYLHAADSFLSASFFEGGQVSLLEAGVSGTICITTNVGLANDLRDFSAVRFVEPNDPSLAEAIHEIWNVGYEERARRGQELSKYVSARYSPQIGVGKYLKLYQSIAN